MLMLLCSRRYGAGQQLLTTVAQVVLSPRALTHAANAQSNILVELVAHSVSYWVVLALAVNSQSHSVTQFTPQSAKVNSELILRIVMLANY